MSYYGAGDYYGAGGLGSILGRIGRGIGGFATGGIIGGIRGVAQAPPTRRGGSPPSPFRGIAIPRIGGGRTTTTVAQGGAPRRRRKMNYANDKALKRSIRRTEGFVKLAKKSLKGTGYKIVSKGSSSRKPMVIHERGPGNVNVR